MNAYLLYISFGLYLTAGVLYLLQLIFTQWEPAQTGFRLTLVAWLVQTVMLALFFVHVGYPFLVNSSISYLFSAWVTGLAFIIAGWNGRLPMVGVFLLPVIATFYLLAQFSGTAYSGVSRWMTSPWASVHLMFSFLALAVFSLSFILGLMFIIQEFQLKYKVLPKIFLKMPSLESLEKVHARALSLGFILLTGGIISGAGWAKSVTGYFFFEDARQLWAIIAWLIYALFLQSRWLAGWRGRRGVLLSILGFIVILFTFLGVEHG
ncbi:MAG: cytochrome c biogenesis protein CcsA [bacterium]|nr:cytochrome c biogenesis protein CcsA [bacterium]